MAAAKNKHSEVVDALLRKGAEVDLARDVSNITFVYSIRLMNKLTLGWIHNFTSCKLLQRQLCSSECPYQAWSKCGPPKHSKYSYKISTRSCLCALHIQCIVMAATLTPYMTFLVFL